MLNEFKIEGDVAIITLTRGYFTKVFVKDLPLISSLKWRVHVKPRSSYAVAYFKASKGIYKLAYMHRIILNAPKNVFVDHKDRDGLNNLSSNLRFATPSQNGMNMIRPKKNGLKGAHFHKGNNTWISQIQVNGKKIHLGTFHSEIEAHGAYCAASKELHGEFGRVK